MPHYTWLFGRWWKNDCVVEWKSSHSKFFTSNYSIRFSFISYPAVIPVQFYFNSQEISSLWKIEKAIHDFMRSAFGRLFTDLLNSFRSIRITAFCLFQLHMHNEIHVSIDIGVNCLIHYLIILFFICSYFIVYILDSQLFHY